jgi:aryl-alcohol dehydrogenase-like predicted oxidoreductase
MRKVLLGRTGLSVSSICLGTMTWGSQTDEADAHAQADLALERGVNFWDTAEMYPVNPVRAETVGDSEAIIGRWLAQRGGRDRVVLATKVTGQGQPAVRDGAALGAAVMRQAVEGSLRRLGSDYIDIYQLHWPNRGTYRFRENWGFDPRGPKTAEIEAHMLEILDLAGRLVEEGKIRHIALSNETVWGAARWLALAQAHGLPRMATVQNEYSALYRHFDTDWAEFSVREDMPLLAFSPLATGLLTGKYQGDVTPPGSRRSLNPTLSGRLQPRVFAAVDGFRAVADKHGWDACQMALAFCRQRPFACIPIVGATTREQLENSLNLGDRALPPEVLADIDAAHRAHPQPF